MSNQPKAQPEEQVTSRPSSIWYAITERAVAHLTANAVAFDVVIKDSKTSTPFIAAMGREWDYHKARNVGYFFDRNRKVDYAGVQGHSAFESDCIRLALDSAFFRHKSQPHDILTGFFKTNRVSSASASAIHLPGWIKGQKVTELDIYVEPLLKSSGEAEVEIVQAFVKVMMEDFPGTWLVVKLMGGKEVHEKVRSSVPGIECLKQSKGNATFYWKADSSNSFTLIPEHGQGTTTECPSTTVDISTLPASDAVSVEDTTTASTKHLTEPATDNDPFPELQRQMTGATLMDETHKSEFGVASGVGGYAQPKTTLLVGGHGESCPTELSKATVEVGATMEQGGETLETVGVESVEGGLKRMKK